MNLSPAAFDKHPATVPVNPSRTHPDRMRAGRLFPASRNPGVGIPIPTVIARDPDMAAARSHGTLLDNSGWRPDLDNHFRLSGHYSKANSQQRSQNQFVHNCLRGTPCKQPAISLSGIPECLTSRLVRLARLLGPAFPRVNRAQKGGEKKAVINALSAGFVCADLHSETLRLLMNQSWPGNVRELRAVLEWSVIVACEGGVCLTTATFHGSGGPQGLGGKSRLTARREPTPSDRARTKCLQQPRGGEACCRARTVSLDGIQFASITSRRESST